ncbi:hypothetical protein [Azospirillum rugosum]|uniref:Uncharacterized protein n=1 Tax=Azospirillum rugosum TaxID=416170 RepID=A0ABS4SMV8_9PROT|nr:hypothetical protein [Azospirillum rugosum]MBP2293257.1 hypothetical protein [Azospirillum rugosum]
MIVTLTPGFLASKSAAIVHRRLLAGAAAVGIDDERLLIGSVDPGGQRDSRSHAQQGDGSSKGASADAPA